MGKQTQLRVQRPTNRLQILLEWSADHLSTLQVLSRLQQDPLNMDAPTHMLRIACESPPRADRLGEMSTIHARWQ